MNFNNCTFIPLCFLFSASLELILVGCCIPFFLLGLLGKGGLTHWEYLLVLISPCELSLREAMFSLLLSELVVNSLLDLDGDMSAEDDFVPST